MIYSPLGSRYAIGGALGRSVKRESSAWLPTDIAGLSLWFDFSDADTLFTDAGTTKVTEDGQAIYQANDKSGNGYNAVQASSGNRPLYKTNIQNSLSISRYGGDDSLFLSDGLSMLNNVPGATIFVVGKASVLSHLGRFIDIASADAAKTRATIYPYNSYFYAAGRRLDANSAQAIKDPVVYDINTFYLLSATFDYANSNLYFYRNSVESVNKLDFQTDGNTSATNSAAIGIGSYAGTGYLQGDIGEVIVYASSLSDSNRASVHTYLNAKWSVY